MFGFVLVDVLWTRNNEREGLSQAKAILYNYFMNIENLRQSIINLLEVDFSAEQFEQSQERDEKVNALKRRLESLLIASKDLAIETFILKDKIVQEIYLDIMWGSLIPIADELSSIKNFRQRYDGFIEIMRSVKYFSDKAIKQLKLQYS